MKPIPFVFISIKTISSGAGSRVSRGIRFGSEAHEEQRRRKVDETAPALPTHFYCQIGAQLGPVYQHGARLFGGRQSSHVLLTFHWSFLCRWSTPQQITSSTTTLPTVSNKQISFSMSFNDFICIFYSNERMKTTLKGAKFFYPSVVGGRVGGRDALVAPLERVHKVLSCDGLLQVAFRQLADFGRRFVGNLSPQTHHRSVPKSNGMSPQ